MNIFVDQNGIVVNEDIGFGFVNLAPFPQPNLNRSQPYTTATTATAPTAALLCRLLLLLSLLLLVLLMRHLEASVGSQIDALPIISMFSPISWNVLVPQLIEIWPVKNGSSERKLTWFASI